MKVVTSSFFFSEIMERNVRLNLDTCMMPPPTRKGAKKHLDLFKIRFFLGGETFRLGVNLQIFCHRLP